MADRDQYDDDYRQRRDRGEEGFFDQLRGWFRGEDRQRRRDPRDRYNRDQNRYGTASGDWYNRDMNRNQDWERTRQWRQNAGQDYDRDYGRNYGRNAFGDRYGENYERADWSENTRDENRYGSGRGTSRDFDYSEGYARSYNRGNYYGQDRDRDMNQDWDRDYRNRDRNRSSASQIYDTDWYDWNFERGFEEDDYNRDPSQFYGYGQNYDRDARYNRNERWNRSFNRGRGQRGQYGTAGMGSDYEGRSGQYRSAGMRSDYGGYGYEGQDYGENDFDYRRGDVGYDSEGAFYQDLDEPVNYTIYEFWMVPGEFTGMGPQNYQRSDERIKEDVCERLTRHGRIDASDVAIDVQDGEVTLKGSVRDREMKRIAENTAETVSGVSQVHNEIRVRQRDQEQSSNWGSNRGRYEDEEYNRSRRQNQQIPSTGAGAAAGPAGETTMGGGLTTAGAIDMKNQGSMEDKRSQLREDMEVIGSNGKVIGRVKEIRSSDFLVDRDMARDIYVPFSQIRSVGAQVMLEVTDDQVDNQGWENPAIL